MHRELIHLTVNGERYEVAVPPQKLLLDVLREDLGLTGAKRGCDDSSCGACTVLVDGLPVLACTAIASCHQEAQITTVEGLAAGGELTPVQVAYGEAGGSQCGFCTPGFMMTIHALLAQNPNPTDAEIREALSSNLCRCTGYMQIYEAIRLAMKRAPQPAEARS
ncbi:MAG: (2Fe-2S)-binding protein [Acidobacteriia bacterium]|jgi:aerobic-type carbon monoxide dehydrogenase small subunit (CoxS/CutS family)|nr:(2Fe-2S)-binding protein [Terriglobia bacterium]